MKSLIRFAGGLLIVALAVVACTGPGQAVPRGVSEGSRAPDFRFQTLDGGEVSLSDYRGKVVLVNLWATWCGPCRAEIPDLEAAHHAHEEDGLIVLGVNQEELRETVEPFVEEMGFTYPVLLDSEGELMRVYRGQGLPMSFIVDADGVIQVRHLGYLSGSQLDQYLTRVLP